MTDSSSKTPSATEAAASTKGDEQAPILATACEVGAGGGPPPHWSILVVGLALGFAFGFAIQKCEVYLPYRIINQFILRDFTVSE